MNPLGVHKNKVSYIGPTITTPVLYLTHWLPSIVGFMDVRDDLLDETSLRHALKSYWGYDEFLPQQIEPIQAVMRGQDSLTVLPTGGGKSLCFQVPAVCREGIVVVVSPLVALMKDQVDGLRECGIPAVAVHSGLSADTKQKIYEQLKRSELKLLYMAPESLLKPRAIDFLATLNVSYFAIDEAHCVSMWGHDFRPEYRELALLRDRFPSTPMHAFTATANPVVRQEIVTGLKLRNPKIMVGDFFRPNLQYHVAKKSNVINQCVSIIDKFPEASGIIYCISRDETETMASELNKLGYSSIAYHAGLSDSERTKRQDAFINDEARIVVATIAFGMGIDKSDVRFVIHAGMPKSLSNYQQESGRAGRDGLESECWLLYSVNDSVIWRRIIENASQANRAASEKSLADIHSYCVATQCRHQLLCEHFGQVWERAQCNACDVCLGRFEQMADSLVVGQKILSCIMRVRENFGAAYVAKILMGSKAADIAGRHHDQLSTFGLLKEFRQGDIRDWIEQLVSQGYLMRVGEYSVLKVTDLGKQLLRGLVTPVLSRTVKQAAEPTRKGVVDSWEGVDMGLFGHLRNWRRQAAALRQVPAYIICGDVTLRDLARRRPSEIRQLAQVHGLGEKKISEFGKDLVEWIGNYCREHAITLVPIVPNATVTNRVSPANTNFIAACEHFANRQSSIEDIATRLSLAKSTVHQYLVQYLLDHKVVDPSHWLSQEEFAELQAVIQYAGWNRLKPIHDALHGRVSYDKIRMAVTILQNQNFRPLEDSA
ncbi:MAG: DNA helicase RecQ [Pirellula sp.]